METNRKKHMKEQVIKFSFMLHETLQLIGNENTGSA